MRLGLDRSLGVQYIYYMGQLLKGDLGQSIFLNMPVASALLERAEPTFFLTLFSLLIASAIALPIGSMRPIGVVRSSTRQQQRWRCWLPAFRASGLADHDAGLCRRLDLFPCRATADRDRRLLSGCII